MTEKMKRRNRIVWLGEFKFMGQYWAPCGGQACHSKTHALEMAKTLAKERDFEDSVRVAKYKRV